MKAPTTLGLFAGKTPIHDQIVVEAGKGFSIAVVVDEPVGVRLEITPALPSTARFNASVIAGVLFEEMNQTYTLTASNARGSVWTELRVFVERDSEYYLQCDAGRAKVTVREGVTGLVEVMEQGDTEPVDGDSVFVSAFCYSIDGCALTLHSFDDGALPPSFSTTTKKPTSRTRCLSAASPSLPSPRAPSPFFTSPSQRSSGRWKASAEPPSAPFRPGSTLLLPPLSTAWRRSLACSPSP